MRPFAEAIVEIVFRSNQSRGEPGAGEIDLRPAPAHGGRIELALSVFNRGPAAFPQGAAPLTCIVVQADPTLDDMLAAALVEQLVERRPLPPHIKLFGAYAADVRAGFKATELPLNDSLEGAYAAVRCSTPGDLTIPENAITFLARWRLMARCILSAAEQSVNPALVPLFREDADFAWARTEVGPRPGRLHSTGFARGPEVAGTHSAGTDTPAAGPVAAAYGEHALEILGAARMPCAGRPRLRVPRRPEWGPPLAVFHGSGTKTQDRRPGRAAARSRSRADPDRAARDGWYDGSKHNATMVAAPVGGTVLDDGAVLRIARKWGHVRVVGGGSKWRFVMAAGVAAMLALGVLLWLPRSQAASDSLFQVSARFNERDIPPGELRREDPAHTRNRSFLTGCDVALKQGPNNLAPRHRVGPGQPPGQVLGHRPIRW